MALSMLQDAQTNRALGIKQQHNDDDRSMSCSPPMLNHSNSSPHPMMNTSTPMSPVFHGFHHHGHHMPTAAQNSMRILAPHLLANQTAAAAALMAAGLPMSLRATLASSGLFSPHHALFGGWATNNNNNNDGLMNNNNNNHNTTISPAPSPTSPILNNNNNNNNNNKKMMNNNNNNTNLANNNHIVSTTTDHLPMNTKKGVKRKQTQQNIKKELEIPRNMISPGPISPPTSGSSPQSTDSIENQNLSVLSTTSSNPPTTVIPNSTRGPSDMLRDKVFTCKICNRSFGYKHVLQNHERTHTGEKPFECPECHKRFTRDHHLKTHMRLHTGEKPYHCSHCDRQFVQVANLRRHLRVHTGERPYQCDLCEARFSDSNQLKAHILIHNGEKPFQCERCHSRFRRRHHLLHHKCGLTSPPTPAISPVMSLSDVKSERSSSIRSETSDESLDLTNPNKPKTLNYLHNQVVPIPLDLSHIESPIELTTDIKRNRKSRDIRRLIRLPQQIMHMPCPEMPEQTEPEDLSMHIPRSPASSLVSHDDDDVDLDDLDDAATLYIKQKIISQRINI